jgi:hypothetical protein
MATTTTPEFSRPRPFGHGPRVPSHLVTREMLRRWGFECRDCPSGHGTVTSGPDFGKARHAAVVAGWLASEPVPSPVERAWAEGKRAAAESRRREGMAEMLAWAATQGAAVVA